MKKAPFDTGDQKLPKLEKTQGLSGSLQNETLSPEDRESLHQVLHELEPYSIPETVVAVFAKDPLELFQSFSAGEREDFPELQGRKSSEIAKLYRIAISMTTDGHTIEAEAVAESLHEALVGAKNRLLATLHEIQDAAISSSDRQAEISGAISGEHLIH